MITVMKEEPCRRSEEHDYRGDDEETRLKEANGLITVVIMKGEH